MKNIYFILSILKKYLLLPELILTYMKNISIYVIVSLFFVFLFTTCKKDNSSSSSSSNASTLVVPSKMTVNIPSSLNASALSKKKLTGAIQPLSGNDIYNTMRLFVAVGATEALLLDHLLTAVRDLHLTSVKKLVFTDSDDQRVKVLTMKQNVQALSNTWQWELQLKDQDSSVALELFWNNYPLQGTAIYNTYECNHNDSWGNSNKNANIRIDYSEADPAYSKEMTVSISGITLVNTDDMNNMKMFVGQNGNMLDVYGNTNNPHCYIFDPLHTGGMQWAFVAHTNTDLDISVAKVSLPNCNVMVNDTTLWGTWSMHNVLYNQIEALYFNFAPADSVNKYLQNTTAPGYFEKFVGFVSCGTNVPTNNNGFTGTFNDLSALKPYVPNDINNLSVTFAK